MNFFIALAFNYARLEMPSNTPASDRARSRRDTSSVLFAKRGTGFACQLRR